MTENQMRGEMHGCIVCGKLYQIYVMRDASGNYIGAKVMNAGGRLVPHPRRPLVACERHTEEDVQVAVKRSYGSTDEDED
ncbi:MAG TPA: hypothetical protein PKL78_04915 [Anaerolineales bacterium]|nr:hypothetical protein [Anaerolineales bacterium]HNN12875.1 hypothetical protein [Anaerolineales bacterium]